MTMKFTPVCFYFFSSKKDSDLTSADVEMARRTPPVFPKDWVSIAQTVCRQSSKLTIMSNPTSGPVSGPSNLREPL